MRKEIALKDAGASRGEGSLTARAAWILSAKVVAFGFTFFLPLLLVRRLDQHEFGLYKQVFLIVGTAVTMLPLGFGMSAYYFLPREPHRQPHIVLNILLFYIVTAGLACLACVLSPGWIAVLFNSPELAGYAPLIGAVILLWVVSSFLDIVAVAHQESRLASLFIVSSQATKSILLIGAAVWAGTVRALIFAALIQGAIQLSILLIYLRSRFAGMWRSLDLSVLKMQLSYALPLGIAGLLFYLQLDLHNYFVSNHFGPAAYAVYAIGCFQLPLVGILNEAASSVMIPRISHLQKHNQSREIIRLTASVMRRLAFIYFPVYAFLMVSGREFITVLFTSQYVDSWPIFAVNITMIPVSILVLDPILRAYAEQRYFLLKLRIGLIVALLIALWFATRHLGLVGTIAVVVGVTLIERLVTTVQMGRVVGLTRRDLPLLKDVGKVAVAAAVAAAATVPVRSSATQASPLGLLLACGAIFFVAYVVSILLLGVLTEQERTNIRIQAARLRWSAWKRTASPIPEGITK